MESLQTEVTGTVATMAKCAHPDCICTVGTGERFCSDYCAEQAGTGKASTDDTCNCGHPECVQTVGGRLSPHVAIPV